MEQEKPQDSPELTKKCKKCQTDISKKAKKCPNCQSDLRNWFMRHKVITVILILIVIGILGSASNSGNNNQSQQSNSKVPTAESSSVDTKSNPVQEAKDEKIYAVKDPVQVGEVIWAALAVEDKGDVLKANESQFKMRDKRATVDAKFIRVSFMVVNGSKEMKSVSSPKLIDDKGREYTSSSDAFDWVPNEFQLVGFANINPSVKNAFVEIYEVPNDAKGLKMIVGDLDMFSNQEAKIDLGL